MSAFITPQDDGLFAIKERVDGEVRPVADHFDFNSAKRALRVYVTDGIDGLDEFCEGLHLDEMENAEVCCSICDGLGHGQPGYGPCPLEERGWMDAMMDDEMERRLGIIPFDEAMRQAERVG